MGDPNKAPKGNTIPVTNTAFSSMLPPIGGTTMLTPKVADQKSVRALQPNNTVSTTNSVASNSNSTTQKRRKKYRMNPGQQVRKLYQINYFRKISFCHSYLELKILFKLFFFLIYRHVCPVFMTS